VLETNVRGRVQRRADAKNGASAMAVRADDDEGHAARLAPCWGRNRAVFASGSMTHSPGGLPSVRRRCMAASGGGCPLYAPAGSQCVLYTAGG